MFRFALIAALCAPLAAFAEPRTDDIISARILPGWQMQDGARMAAIQLQLAPDWKTYWRTPGEAGIPPEFDWSGSRNLRAVKFHWPRPEVFETAGMQTIGYRRELVLPVEVTPIDPSQPVHLRATVDLGVCRDICVPAEVALQADLTGAGAQDAAISAALHQQPTQATAKATCSVEPIDDGLRVTARIDLPPQGGSEVVILEPSDPTIWTSEGETRREGRHLSSTVEMVATSGAPFALDRSGMKVTVLGHDRAVEINGCPGG